MLLNIAATDALQGMLLTVLRSLCTMSAGAATCANWGTAA